MKMTIIILSVLTLVLVVVIWIMATRWKEDQKDWESEKTERIYKIDFLRYLSGVSECRFIPSTEGDHKILIKTNGGRPHWDHYIMEHGKWKQEHS